MTHSPCKAIVLVPVSLIVLLCACSANSAKNDVGGPTGSPDADRTELAGKGGDFGVDVSLGTGGTGGVLSSDAGYDGSALGGRSGPDAGLGGNSTGGRLSSDAGAGDNSTGTRPGMDAGLDGRGPDGRAGVDTRADAALDSAVMANGDAGKYKPNGTSGRFVQMVAPAPSETFLAPASLRVVAAGKDPNIYTNSPSPGLGGNAAQVQFFVDDQNVLSVDGGQAEYWVFKGFVANVGAGTHRVWARAIYTNPDEILDSLPIVITVATLPTSAKIVDLSEDVQVGSAGYSLIGTKDSRIRLNGHGHKIVGANAGGLTLKYVDAVDLGSPTDTGKPGIDVATTGSVVIEDSSFESCNPLKLSLGGTAPASLRRNVFHSNMRQPIGQYPDSFQSTGASYAAITIEGASTGEKVFAGNNVGAGWVEFVRTKQWIVGGDSDADSNVLIGPRVGISTGGSSAMIVKRNYSHHVYLGGWSQGANFEMFDTSGSTFEHNVIFDSSWPVRGGGSATEFRYNLVLVAGHEWMQPAAGTAVHHNLFVGGDQDQGGFYIYNSQASPGAASIDISNNTFDGLAGTGIMAAVRMGNTAGPVRLVSNAFLRYPKVPVVLVEAGAGAVSADYNGFFACQGAPYSDDRKPSHDVSAAAAPFVSPPAAAFSLDEGLIWTRSTGVAEVLSAYRANYSPKPSSPVLDAGDPQGLWIGAVGPGTSPSDLFGKP